MYAEVPLALSTTFSLIGAGSFIVLAVLIGLFRFEQKQLNNIDILSVIPGLAIVLGLAAAFFGFQDQTNAAVLLRDFCKGAVGHIAVCIGGLFVFSVVLYCLWVNFGKATEARRRLLLGIAGVLGLLFVFTIGIIHMTVANLCWSTLATPAQMFGFALLGGSVLAVLIFEKAGALGDSSIKKALMFFALFGVVLSVGGFAAQIAMVLNVGDAAGDFMQAASLHITVTFFCLLAAFLFEMMAIRMEETGFHSVIAVACVFVGVFCARLVFYALPVAGAA